MTTHDHSQATALRRNGLSLAQRSVGFRLALAGGLVALIWVVIWALVR